MQKNETRPVSFTIRKSSLKMDQRFNVRSETIKLLGKTMKEKFQDIGLGKKKKKKFDITPKSTGNKGKKWQIG